MKKISKKKLMTACTVLALTASVNSYAEEVTISEGNRYNKPRAYLSEISAARAYLNMKREKAVLVDVRRLREYAAGHPGKAFNIPYPHIVDSNDQSPEDFYWEVYDLVEGETDTQIMTLCRTGSRSVDAGRVLSDPGEYGIEAPAFTNVRNIWEGFVGQYKYAYTGGNINIAVDEDYNAITIPLDLDNSGAIDSDTWDVYSHTTDANPDKDGWRNFQELPWRTELKEDRVYLQELSLYDPYIE